MSEWVADHAEIRIARIRAGTMNTDDQQRDIRR